MMRVVQVDVVGPQPSERRLTLGNDMASGQSSATRTAIIRSFPNPFLNLRGDDHSVPPATNSLADKLL